MKPGKSPGRRQYLLFETGQACRRRLESGPCGRSPARKYKSAWLCRACMREKCRLARRRHLENVVPRLQERLGRECECCQEWRPQFLALDHRNAEGTIGNGRLRLRRPQIADKLVSGKLRWEDFRWLCHNCNMARGNSGICPHELERYAEAILCA